MPLGSDLSVSSFLDVTNLRFFAVCHFAILASVLFHFPDMSLLALELAGFVSCQVALVDTLVNALLLTDLALADVRCADLSCTCCCKSEYEQEEMNVFGFHGYLFYTPLTTGYPQRCKSTVSLTLC